MDEIDMAVKLTSCSLHQCKFHDVWCKYHNFIKLKIKTSKFPIIKTPDDIPVLII